jgi:hypothetical protein
LVDLPGTKSRGESWREEERRNGRRHSQPLRAGTKISLLSQDCNREQPQKPDGKSLFLFTVELAPFILCISTEAQPKRILTELACYLSEICVDTIFSAFMPKKGSKVFCRRHTVTIVKANDMGFVFPSESGMQFYSKR